MLITEPEALIPTEGEKNNKRGGGGVISDYKLLKHSVRDFSMLKDNSKRLLCSITQERDFYAQSQKKETSKQLQRIEKV